MLLLTGLVAFQLTEEQQTVDATVYVTVIPLQWLWCLCLQAAIVHVRLVNAAGLLVAKQCK